MPGVAELPLHDGRVPGWMLKLMERMSEAIVDAIVELHGPEALVRGLSDPLWFQAFNNVIGMDWDSSGSTTVLLGILKSVTWRRPDLGVLVLGGKGSRMLDVPVEAVRAGELLGLDPAHIARFSKLAARLDSVFLQDGYTLYHHSVIVSRGCMVVVQQGMNVERGLARRYHVDKATVEEPHSGVAGVPGEVLNATARESRDARRAYLDIIAEGPSRIVRLLGEANRMLESRPSLEEYMGGVRVERRGSLVGLKPYYYPVRPSKQMLKAIEDLSRFNPTDEVELALAPSLGPKTLRALALIADLIYRVPTSTRDPVTHPPNPFIYAYAVGGKDRVPYPYDRRTAEKVILTLEEAVNRAKLGDREKLRALLRLRRLLPDPR
jgi:hypothetical protein